MTILWVSSEPPGIEIPCTVTRARRKTFRLDVRSEGLAVTVPHRATEADIRAILQKKERWILRKWSEQKSRDEAMAAVSPMTPAEMRERKAAAEKLFKERVRYYAPIVGVTYGRITIRFQKSRWGSCSANGNLSFNGLLLDAPPDVLDSVVVHELCHRIEMSHSARFYRELLRVLPDYRARHRWLKENQPRLMARLPKEKP